MQNSKGNMQTGTGVRQLGARALVSLCIVHCAFFMTTLSAQQQPGMPGSMGFSSGIVASNVPPQFKDVTFKQRLGDRLPLDAHFRAARQATNSSPTTYSGRPALRPSKRLS